MVTRTIMHDNIADASIQSAPGLENWSLQHERIVGSVCGHPTIPHGHEIQTSEIIKLDQNIAHTRNSMYRLGEKARF